MSTTLQANLRNAAREGREPLTVVELAGSIDPATLETLEAAMDRCQAERRHRVVFDLHELRYINSTGMGMLVQFSDACRDNGGALALMRVQPKVLLVIEMLGLQEIFHIVADEDAAFAALDGVGASAGAASVAGPASSEASATVDQAVCPACQAPLRLPSPGWYRCPRCLANLEIDAERTLKGYAEESDRVAEFWLPPHGDFLDPMQGVLAGAARRAGLSAEAGAALASAAAACWKTFAAMLLTSPAKGDRRLRIFVRAAEGRLVVRTQCGGEALAADAFDAVRPGVDRLDYAVTPQGNLLTLEKGK